MVDSKKSDSGLTKEGFNEKFISDIKKRIKDAEFKRKSAIIPLV
jgi:hypothetical protein